jgi:hypothetical protein
MLIELFEYSKENCLASGEENKKYPFFRLTTDSGGINGTSHVWSIMVPPLKAFAFPFR